MEKREQYPMFLVSNRFMPPFIIDSLDRNVKTWNARRGIGVCRVRGRGPGVALAIRDSL